MDLRFAKVLAALFCLPLLNAACKQLGQALRDAYPHGRDYQTHPDAENARTLDLVQFNRAFQKLAEIEALAQRYTNRIAKQ